MDLLYLKAKKELLTASGDNCQQFFEQNNCILELAYFRLYHQEPMLAYKLFMSLAESDIRAHWGAFLASICAKKISGYPSYLELRNFFEIDLNIMFAYYLGDYIEEICNYSDWLVTINSEVYKYIGRVFFKNNYMNLGFYFLKRALDYFYNDPELHYLLAEYHLTNEEKDEALKYAKSCLKVLPEYFPAINLIQNLTRSL